MSTLAIIVAVLIAFVIFKFVFKPIFKIFGIIVLAIALWWFLKGF